MRLSAPALTVGHEIGSIFDSVDHAATISRAKLKSLALLVASGARVVRIKCGRCYRPTRRQKGPDEA